MKREEKKRKFNEAIVAMLFPPPPSPPQEEPKPMQASNKAFHSDPIPDALDGCDNACSRSSSEDEEESEGQKLTRAQRKKIRKKKLKEESIRRGKLIGPLNHTPPVRSNASETLENVGTEETGAQCSKRVNQRRKAKRSMLKVMQNSSNAENPNPHLALDSCSAPVKEDH